VQLVSKISNIVILIHKRYRGQTDEHSDRSIDMLHMQSQDRVLHYSASRGKKSSIKKTTFLDKLTSTFMTLPRRVVEAQNMCACSPTLFIVF